MREVAICQYCGMGIDLSDPYFHAERYGHEPQWAAREQRTCKYVRGTEKCDRPVFTDKGYCKRHASAGGSPLPRWQQRDLSKDLTGKVGS